MEIDEAICVVPHNPEWFEQFSHERDSLQKILEDIVVDVRHIGSTAVSGMVAKPIIDIMLGLRSLAVDTTFINQMETLGYEYLGEAGVSGRLYFRKRNPLAFNVHVVEWKGIIWQNNLRLREYLRENPNLAAKYGQYKLALLDRGVKTLLEYSELKASFLTELLQQAQNFYTDFETFDN